MILSDKKILEAIDKGQIVIEPFNRACLGTNSYDVHLSKYLAVYKDKELDAKKHNEIEEVVSFKTDWLAIIKLRNLQWSKAMVQRFERFCDVMFAINVASDADIDVGHSISSFLSSLYVLLAMKISYMSFYVGAILKKVLSKVGLHP